jgi:hypothetical protein
MSVRRRTLPWLALIASCAAVAGCGGGEEPSDTAQIASVLKSVATSTSVKVQCDTGVTDRFIREVYRSAKKCREVSKDTDSDSPARSATVTDTRIAGDRATTALAMQGGDADGVEGRVALAKVDGDWKLDRFGLDFVRSSVGLLAQASSAEERSQARCFAAAARPLSSTRLRRAINALYGERIEDLPTQMRRCLLGDSLAREALEEGIFEGFREEGLALTPTRKACLRRKLREISDEELVDAFSKSQLPADFESRLRRALLSC